MNDAADREKKALSHSFQLAGLLVLSLWLAMLLNVWSGGLLYFFGIRPRIPEGIPGIFLAPFIHGSFLHLFSNSVPLFVLISGLIYLYRRIWVWVLSGVLTLGGLGVWLFARSSNHIGVSGVVYGLAVFIFASGLIRKNIRSMALSLLVVFLYGGLVRGLFPVDAGVSYEAHLSGALGGLFFALVFRKVEIEDEKEEDDDDEEEDEGDEDDFDE